MTKNNNFFFCQLGWSEIAQLTLPTAEIYLFGFKYRYFSIWLSD